MQAVIFVFNSYQQVKITLITLIIILVSILIICTCCACHDDTDVVIFPDRWHWSAWSSSLLLSSNLQSNQNITGGFAIFHDFKITPVQCLTSRVILYNCSVNRYFPWMSTNLSFSNISSCGATSPTASSTPASFMFHSTSWFRFPCSSSSLPTSPHHQQNHSSICYWPSPS